MALLFSVLEDTLILCYHSSIMKNNYLFTRIAFFTFFILGFSACTNSVGNSAKSNSHEKPLDNSEHTVHFILTYDDRKDFLEFDLTGKGQDEIKIPADYIPADYKPASYKPYKPTIFADVDVYEIGLKSKYVYSPLTGESKESFSIPFVCRDFRGYDEEGSGDGFITQEHVNTYGGYFAVGHGHPDFERYNAYAKNIVMDLLGPDGLPVFNDDSEIKFETGITKESFSMWYKDVPGINKTFCKVLTLKQKEEPYNYAYESDYFFPLNNEGYGNHPSDKTKNFHFTDDMCFYFNYHGDESSIKIIGDDDIWIFVNGILAVDLGGCHGSQNGVVNFTGEMKTGTLNEKQISYLYNSDFDIVEGQNVEVRIFHAERHTSGSNFNLYLNNLDIRERKLKE